MLKEGDIKSFSTFLLGREAEARGIKVEKPIKIGHLSKQSTLRLSYAKHREIIVGQRTSKTDCIAYWIQHNKELAKTFFREAGICVAKSEVFDYRQVKEIIKFCRKIKFPVVIKPLRGVQGKKVFVGVDSDYKIRQFLKEYAKGKFKTVIVEKEFHGEEYRIFATREKFVAAIHRVPANVIGDGLHNIEELIKIKNSDPRRGEGHTKSLVKIRVDEVVIDFLKKKNLKLSDVPPKDKIVYLRSNSNISTGGDSYDVTNIVHSKIKKLAPKIIQAIPGLAYGGIDYLTKDVTQAPTSRNYIIIEVNDSPMISMHHFPYAGKSRNVAKVIIDMLFPETIKK